MVLQSLMTVWASSTESNASTERTSSRTREPNDSTNGFCQGEPGSMKLRPLPPPAPVADGVRGHLGAVVHPHELRCGAALTDDLVEHPHRVVGVDRAGNTDRQGLAGVLIDHVEQLQRAAVDGRVELEVQRPDVIRALRPQPLRGHSRVAKAKPFPFALRHAQALLAPQPLNLLAVHRPALVADSAPGQPVTPTRVLRGELPQPRAERVVALASATMIVALG